MHLDIDFWWILVDFWSQVGWKIHQKSIQKGIEKTIEKSRRLGSVLEACWGVLRRPGSSKPQTSPAESGRFPPHLGPLELYNFKRLTVENHTKASLLFRK